MFGMFSHVISGNFTKAQTLISEIYTNKSVISSNALMFMRQIFLFLSLKSSRMSLAFVFPSNVGKQITLNEIHNSTHAIRIYLNSTQFNFMSKSRSNARFIGYLQQQPLSIVPRLCSDSLARTK